MVQSRPHYATFHHFGFWIFQRNRFSEQIPVCIKGGLGSLEVLNLNDNNLRGHIPREISNFSSLVVLQLQGNNQLTGELPTEIFRLVNLTIMQLGNNWLHGTLPDQLCNLPKLNIMVMSNNRFSGTIPPCLSNASFGITNSLLQRDYGEEVVITTKNKISDYVGDIVSQMSELDLSSNRLSGDIPPELGYLKKLHSLNMSHNNLTGSIPKSFSNLGSIESMDLSYNCLRGVIPSQLVSLNFLEVFNVSYNNLSGNVPARTGQFGSFDFYSYEGNPFLRGYEECLSCGVVKI